MVNSFAKALPELEVRFPGASDWGGIFDGKISLALTSSPHRQILCPQLTSPPIPYIRYIIRSRPFLLLCML